MFLKRAFSLLLQSDAEGPPRVSTMRIPVPLSLYGVRATPQPPFQAMYSRPPGARAPRVRTRWWLISAFALALGLAYLAGTFNPAPDTASVAGLRLART